MAGYLAFSCKESPAGDLILVTEKIASSPECRISSLNLENPSGTYQILTDSFYSARAPRISYDGRFMLFNGKRKKSDSWQIWEMELESSVSRQITSSSENCTDPVYLPGDRIAYSKAPAKDTLGAGTALFTCNLQGTDVRQITFHPHNDFAATVLKDGRILAFSNQVYPARERPVLFVLRPDGTKGDLFFNDNPGRNITGSVWETADGLIYFIDSDTLHPNNGQVAIIHQNSPFHTYARLTSNTGDFESVFPTSAGKLLVSYRNNVNETYALYECDPKTGLLGKPIYSDPACNLVDVVAAEASARPRLLPSEVDMEVKTGLLMCQDINFTDLLNTRSPSRKKATQIEVLGINASFGKVKVEEDGSFYLKAIADIPVRIQTLDEKGNIVGGPGAWIWLRPNERRGCIGCHEDHELAPENRVAFAVKKPPVMIPVHIKTIDEKDIELE